MQIANSMGIEVGGADKADQYAAELTYEMELSSGGDKEEAETAEENNAEEARRIVERVYFKKTSFLSQNMTLRKS